MRRKITCLFLILSLIAAILPIGALAEFEGDGFRTPEEAVLAYIDAMRDCDIEGMVATFAIETKIENGNLNASLLRTRAATPNLSFLYPANNDYTRQLLVSKAYSDLITALHYQYIVYATIGTQYSNLGQGMPVMFTGENPEEEISSYIEAMSAVTFPDALQSCEFVDWVAPASLHSSYNAEQNQRNIDKVRACWGADEIAHPCAKLKINGEDWLLLMECVRYDDTWYNLDLRGNTANLAGVDPFRAGLVPMDELM